MKRLVLRLPVTALCVGSLALAHAAIAQAAPPCDPGSTATLSSVDFIVGKVATGHTTHRVDFAGSAADPVYSNVAASVSAPGRVSLTPVTGKTFDVVLDLPAPGNVTLTITWDQLPEGQDSGPMCTATEVERLKAYKPVRVVPSYGGTGISDIAVGGGFGWEFVCEGNPFVISPLTITMRYRVGPRRPPRPIPPRPTPAPNAHSPKLTITLANSCTSRPKTTVLHSGSVFVRFGAEPLSGGTHTAGSVTTTVRRKFAGRGTFSAHIIVTFSQPGYKPLRYDMRGYSGLGDYGRVTNTDVKRLS